MLTWLVEFRPGNKTMYVVFDEESECSGPRMPKLSLDQVLLGKAYPRKIVKIRLVNPLFKSVSCVPPLWWGARLPSHGQYSSSSCRPPDN